eukprot:14639972-Alexandrium_andersonii.AAC.1
MAPNTNHCALWPQPRTQALRGGGQPLRERGVGPADRSATRTHLAVEHVAPLAASTGMPPAHKQCLNRERKQSARGG